MIFPVFLSGGKNKQIMRLFLVKKVTFAIKVKGVFFDIQLPDSKSIKIRQMMVAHVHGRELPTVSERDSHDVWVTRLALSTVKAALESCSSEECVVDVEDCGAAYRFLLPLLAVSPCQSLLTGTPRLLQRPVEPLVEALLKIGADIQRTDAGWRIHGKPLKAKEMSIDASLSSQMASALVLAAPLLELKTLHLIPPHIPSMPYLQMTLACTKDYPVEIPGVTVPEGPVGATGDWSAALFWFAHARLHPENQYRLSPLSDKSIQGDSVIYKWFKELNASISTDSLSMIIHAEPLSKKPKMVLDVQHCLDTVPVMAALAALLPADITFQNVTNLQYKESDRLHALAEQLSPYAEITLSDSTLRINGKGALTNTNLHFDTHHDHRLAMAFLLFGPSAVLNDTDCLRKSYPGLMEELGFKV